MQTVATRSRSAPLDQYSAHLSHATLCVFASGRSCVGILHEAYSSFKSRARSVRNANADAEPSNAEIGAGADCGAVVAAAARGAPSSAAMPDCIPADTTDPAAAAAAVAGGRRFLRFCLLVTVAAYAERFGDRFLARLPLYSLAKLALTVAIMAPNQVSARGDVLHRAR